MARRAAVAPIHPQPRAATRRHRRPGPARGTRSKSSAAISAHVKPCARATVMGIGRRVMGGAAGRRRVNPFAGAAILLIAVSGSWPVGAGSREGQA